MRYIIKSIKKTIADMDKVLLVLTVAFFIFGLFNIVTASSREAVVRYEASLFHYFYKQLEMLIIGLFGSIIILKINTKHYKPLAFIGFILILLATLRLYMTGNVLKGAQNWLTVFGFTFQPSEFAKPIIIVSLAVLFEKYYKKLRNKNIFHYDLIGVLLFVGIFIPIVVFFQKDFGTMFIMLTIFGVLFLSSPILKKEKFRTIIVLGIIAILAGFILINQSGHILSATQLERFDFYNPCTRYETGGYQTCNGFIALNDGGLFGLGIGNSKQKYSYIPEPHTDSVFAIIGEEQGFIRSTFIFLGYIIILYRILSLSSKADTIRGKYICLGVGTYIFMHIMVNLGGLFGIMPLTGVPLPFLSYGGTFAISLIGSLSVVQRIHIETKRAIIKV